MTKAELRRVMRERKKALRRELAERRRQARAQLRSHPAAQKARRRRWIQRSVGPALIALLLMFLRCECEPPKPGPARLALDAGVASEPKKVVVPPTKTPPPPPLHGRIESQPRTTYRGTATPTPSWLEEFRLQVAARSPRLAQCFTGSDRPGALRWTTAVNGQSGAVSDHGLEPVGTGGDLDGKQRECVLKVLSDPKYRLPSQSEATLPQRISLVIEF